MSNVDRNARDGVIAGLAAYLMWGFLPVYFVLVRDVDPTEVLAHRVIWAVPFGALILSFRHQWAEVGRALTHRTMLGWLTLSALFIGMNWFVYIWAIGDGRILETSLGYYINPLTNMLVGFWLFGERFAVTRKSPSVSQPSACWCSPLQPTGCHGLHYSWPLVSRFMPP